MQDSPATGVEVEVNSLESDTPPFLPDMCTLQAVFLLVMLGELLALALTLADSGLAAFDWEGLGFRSFLVQWIVLLSAAFLCPLRFRLSRLSPWLAGTVCYLLVLGVTLVCSLLGIWVTDGWQAEDGAVVLGNLILSAIFAGIVLRYLYVQQQWSNQQKAELRARIQALQSRIHPHFLFNSMNSIASLIASQPDKAERMVEDLSCLFRASLAEPGLVPLREELDLCRQYMDIEQIRLGDRLQVQWHIDETVESGHYPCPVPSLLIQPLLENAIQHGIQSLASGGRVTIDISLDGGRVNIQITNPVGDGERSANGNHMALANIDHRLQAHFGSVADFQVTTEPGVDDLPARFVARLSYPCDGGHG